MDFVVIHHNGDVSRTFIVMPMMAVVMALFVAVFTTAFFKFKHNLFSCRMLRRLINRCPFTRTAEASVSCPLEGILRDLN
jgi:hypothetical protein